MSFKTRKNNLSGIHKKVHFKFIHSEKVKKLANALQSPNMLFRFKLFNACPDVDGKRNRK